jgi:hypothetical protein
VLGGERVRERFGLPIFPAFPAITSRERLARCLGELGEFAEGLRVGEEGMRIAEELDHATSLTAMCLGLGLLHMRRDDPDRATSVLERGMDVGRRWNVFVYVFTLAAAVGRMYAVSGRVAEGLALLQGSVQEAASTDAALGHALRLAWLAEGHLIAGEHEPAWDRAQQSLALARRYREKGQEAWTLQLLGDIAARHAPADVDGAAQFYRDGMSIADALGMRPAVAHCQLGLGELASRAGGRDAGREHLTAAAVLFREMGLTALQERAELQLGGR